MLLGATYGQNTVLSIWSLKIGKFQVEESMRYDKGVRFFFDGPIFEDRACNF